MPHFYSLHRFLLIIGILFTLSGCHKSPPRTRHQKFKQQTSNPHPTSNHSPTTVTHIEKPQKQPPDPRPPEKNLNPQTSPQSSTNFSKPTLSIAFYNVENLFDTLDDPYTNDNQFTPFSELRWDSQKYNTKLKHISTVLNDLNADFVGLEEVENRKVLEDLLPHLNRHYKILHKDSPDKRGIDVCALYDPEVWHIIDVTWLNPNPYLSGYLNAPTRYILEVITVPIQSQSDTFVFYVNHWPSRRNDEITRILTAKFLKQRLALYQQKPHYFIIIGGDLNDEPFNKSVRHALGASSQPNSQSDLIDLAYQYTFYGTHQYQKRWHILDHIIVSRNLFQHYKVIADVFHPDYLLEDSGPYAGFPWRTAVWDRYLGGYSDHLPVMAQLIPLE